MNPNGAPKQYWWKKGQSGNPKGRPKGFSLKEYTRKRLEEMPEEERLRFLNSITPELAWRMAEGNPTEKVDMNTKIESLVKIQKDTAKLLENARNKRLNKKQISQ